MYRFADEDPVFCELQDLLAYETDRAGSEPLNNDTCTEIRIVNDQKSPNLSPLQHLGMVSR